MIFHTTQQRSWLAIHRSELENAVGLLKEEMRRLNSLIIKAADLNRVPAGGALAVDRNAFSEYITDIVENHQNIDVHYQEIKEIPKSEYTIIATGPLSSPSSSEAISQFVRGLSLFL